MKKNEEEKKQQQKEQASDYFRVTKPDVVTRPTSVAVSPQDPLRGLPASERRIDTAVVTAVLAEQQRPASAPVESSPISTFGLMAAQKLSPLPYNDRAGFCVVEVDATEEKGTPSPKIDSLSACY